MRKSNMCGIGVPEEIYRKTKEDKITDKNNK